MGELAERLHLRPHSVVGLVDRLCTKGLVRRRRDPQDRRRVRIELTAKGCSLLRRLSLAHRDELRRLAPLFGRLLSNVGRTSNA